MTDQVNVVKLQQLRDEHRALLDRYNSATEQLRFARKAVDEFRLQHAPVAEMEQAAALWHGPVDLIRAMSPDDVKAAGLDARLVEMLVGFVDRAEVLAVPLKGMRADVHASLRLMERLEAYASARQTRPLGHDRPTPPKSRFMSASSPYLEKKPS